MDTWKAVGLLVTSSTPERISVVTNPAQGAATPPQVVAGPAPAQDQLKLITVFCRHIIFRNAEIITQIKKTDLSLPVSLVKVNHESSGKTRKEFLQRKAV